MNPSVQPCRGNCGSRWKCCLFACISSLALWVQNDIYTYAGDSDNPLDILYDKLGQAIAEPTYTLFLVAVLLYFAYRFLLPRFDPRAYRIAIPFSAVASLALMLCDSYQAYNNWDMVFGTPLSFVLSIFRGTGLAVIIFFVFCTIERFTISVTEGQAPLTRREFLLLICLLLLCWVPYFVLQYPGAANGDIRDQLAQIMGDSDNCWTAPSIILQYDDSLWNTHHPPFHTFLLMIFLSIGQFIGSAGMGMELFCLVQCVLLALALVLTLSTLRQMGLSRRWQRGLLIFFALNPMFPLWGMTLMKDSLYSIVMLLLVLQLYRFLSGFTSWKNQVLLSVTALVLMLLRNNGFYILLVLLPFAVWHLWRNKKLLKRLVLILLIPILIFKIGVESLLYPALHISNGSIRETLSVPFQQTARLVQEYGDEISEEDAAAILAVLQTEDGTLDELAEDYRPHISDKIKRKFNPEATAEDLQNYFRAWAHGLVQHPGVYVEAFLNLTFSWFTFDSHFDIIYYHYTYASVGKVVPGVENIPGIRGLQTAIYNILNLAARLPFLSWMFEMSFYTWAYLIMAIVMLCRGKRRELLTCAPILLNYLISFLGPLAYMRYAYPAVLCFPFMVFLAFSGKTELHPVPRSAVGPRRLLQPDDSIPKAAEKDTETAFSPEGAIPQQNQASESEDSSYETGHLRPPDGDAAAPAASATLSEI